MFRAGVGDNYLIILAAMLLLPTTFTSAGAQTLSFGPTGAGGAGPWDNTTANWFNGSTAVPWAGGNTAVFGGAAGTATVNGTVAVGGAAFSTNGHVITGGTLTLSGIAPTITTNAGISATISSVITGSAALVKTGTGTLTIGNGANTYTGGTTISQGTLVFGGNQALGSGTVTLGDANTGAANVSLLANFGNFFSVPKIANNIVVSGLGAGAVTIGSTSFNPGSNGTIFSGIMTLNRDVTLVSGNTDRTTFTGKITGAGNITIAGSRITFDNSTNDFVGNVTISSGSILQTNAANVLPRTATVTILGNGVLRFVNTGDQTIDGLNGSSNGVITFLAGGRPNLTVGAANGSGNFAGQIGNVISSFTKLGAGTQILSGANTYAGRTTISGGVLSTQLLANGGAASGIGASTSAAANLVLDGGTLRYTGTGASTDRQFTLTANGGGLDASGAGALNFTNTAAIALSGTGPRTLTLSGSNSGANTLAAILGDSGGPSSLVKAGAGSWMLTGNNSYTGSTTLSAGTLALSGAGSIASSARVIADGTFDISGVTAASSSIKSLAGNGSVTLGSKTLVITAANDTFSGGITGSGGLTVSGGTQTLAGNNSYTGATNVDAGTLLINGDQSGATGLTSVASAATLGGAGIIGGSVTVADGGAINPGNAGNVPGTLTIAGDLTLNQSSALNYNFGQANVVGGPFNDLINVGGNLTLAGALNVVPSPGASFDVGVYRVLSYGGALTDNGLTVGAAPPGVPTLFVQTSVAGQINLVNATNVTLKFWDGAAGPKNNALVNGGSGVWHVAGADDNWTDVSGSINAPYSNGAFAVFQGQAGTVTVDNSLGQAQSSGMQFATDGYVIAGAPLVLVETLAGTGATTIRVGDGTAAGSSATATIDAALGGTSQLVKTDLGVLALNGTNTYTGGTAIRGGTVRISRDANLGAVSGGLTLDGGALQNTAAFTTARPVTINGRGGTFQTDADLAVSGAVGGDGALTKTGSAALILAGSGAYTGGTTISTGTLQLGNGGTSGSIVGDVLNNGTLAFNRSDSFIFGGVISGSGVVNQIGRGTTVLTAVSPFAGAANVNAGTLAVNGSLAGATVTVQSGATLAGNGTVGATTLLSGARIAPGNSIGTLTVNGAYAQAAGATYQVELDPATSTSDLVRVNGAATLASGAGLSVVNDTGAPFVAGQRFTILTSTGLTGTYGFGDQVLTPFLNLRDVYDANNAYLTVIQTRTVGSIGATPNQIAVGAGVDSLPSGNPVQTGLVNQVSVDAARNALDQISGEIHASAKSALVDESWLLRNAVNDRLRSAFGAVGAQPMAVMNYGFTADLAPNARGPMPMLKPADRFAVWGQGYGYWGRTDSDGNASKLTRSSGGFLLGADAAAFNNLRFGVLAGYSRSAFDVNARLSSGESDNYHLGLYGGGQFGALSLRAGASYTWHDVETRRTVVASALGSRLRADYDAGTAQVFGEAGYRVELGQDFGKLALEPFAGLAYVNLHSDGFSETGGAAALSARSDDTSLGYSTLGLRASTTLPLQGMGLQDMGLTMRGGLAWRHAFGDVDPKTTLAFAGSNAFTVAGLPIARDAALIEAGLDFAISQAASLGVSYIGQLAAGTQDHAFKGVLTVRF